MPLPNVFKLSEFSFFWCTVSLNFDPACRLFSFFLALSSKCQTSPPSSFPRAQVRLNGVRPDKALLVFLTIVFNKMTIEGKNIISVKPPQVFGQFLRMDAVSRSQPRLRFFETCLSEKAFISCCSQHVMKSPCDILIFPVINITTSCN